MAASARSSGPFVSLREIADMLASTLGFEKSAEAVSSAARTLGFGAGPVTPAHAGAVLVEIARTPGIVGAAARFARSRAPQAWRAPPPAPVEVDDDGPTSSVRAHPIGELTESLAKTMGRERAAEVVAEAMDHLGLPAHALTDKQTLAVLDHLSQMPGLLGITARFAKTRAILRLGGLLNDQRGVTPKS